MSRYKMKVLLRAEIGEDQVVWFHPVRSNITADSEEAARRLVLERAWASGLLVTRFLSIKRRKEMT